MDSSVNVNCTMPFFVRVKLLFGLADAFPFDVFVLFDSVADSLCSILFACEGSFSGLPPLTMCGRTCSPAAAEEAESIFV